MREQAASSASPLPALLFAERPAKLRSRECTAAQASARKSMNGVTARRRLVAAAHRSRTCISAAAAAAAAAAAGAAAVTAEGSFSSAKTICASVVRNVSCSMKSGFMVGWMSRLGSKSQTYDTPCISAPDGASANLQKRARPPGIQVVVIRESNVTSSPGLRPLASRRGTPSAGPSCRFTTPRSCKLGIARISSVREPHTFCTLRASVLAREVAASNVAEGLV
mmetsp:Transcript_7663/g.20030  ORF Transcript_7663/g.20030 Transcript_7663/m.20030 type:complete len:223 (+) Transcript_7663:517-1185(+)